MNGHTMSTYSILHLIWYKSTFSCGSCCVSVANRQLQLLLSCDMTANWTFIKWLLSYNSACTKATAPLIPVDFKFSQMTVVTCVQYLHQGSSHDHLTQVQVWERDCKWDCVKAQSKWNQIKNETKKKKKKNSSYFFVHCESAYMLHYLLTMICPWFDCYSEK